MARYGLKRNGKLKKGCRFKRGGKVVCSTTTRKRARRAAASYRSYAKKRHKRGRKSRRVVLDSYERFERAMNACLPKRCRDNLRAPGCLEASQRCESRLHPHG